MKYRCPICDSYPGFECATCFRKSLDNKNKFPK